jgi:hypothetical protein
VAWHRAPGAGGRVGGARRGGAGGGGRRDGGCDLGGRAPVSACSPPRLVLGPARGLRSARRGPDSLARTLQRTEGGGRAVRAGWGRHREGASEPRGP